MIDEVKRILTSVILKMEIANRIHASEYYIAPLGPDIRNCVKIK